MQQSGENCGIAVAKFMAIVKLAANFSSMYECRCREIKFFFHQLDAQLIFSLENELREVLWRMKNLN